MVWIGLILGIVIGGSIWGFDGAVVLGFVFWLGALIFKSSRRSASEPAEPVASTAAVPTEHTLEVRVLRLEQMVKSLQARLARLEPEQATLAPEADAATEPVVAAAEPVLPETAVAAEAVAPAERVMPAHAEVQPEAEAVAVEVANDEPNFIVAWLTGGNTIARVGLLILFIGLAFLLKYAADHSMLPVELRVAAVALGGIALLVVGWRLREKRRGYALGLQGAGVAVLYLTTFAALRLWHLLPAPAAFALLAAIAVFSAILAVKQDAMVLAAFGAGGGFLAPILASTGGGNHAMLFTYYLVLNLGIAAVALYKAWRPLNLLGFLFTFVIGLMWGAKFYRAEYFDSTEPFLIAFFLLYVAIAILFARRQPPQLKHYVDGTIVFGVPLVAFGLQAALLKGTPLEEFGLAYSALAMSALYLSLAAVLRRAARENYALLSETFIALGVVFATAAIPLALDARWTSASWALEGAAIVWLGVRQDRKLARAFGLLLQPLAAGAFFNGLLAGYGEAPMLLEPPFIGALLMAGAGIWIYRLLRNAGDAVTKAESAIAVLAFAWGVAWWLFAGSYEIASHVRPEGLAAQLMLVTFTAVALGLLGLRRGWIEAAFSTRFLLPLLVVFTFASLASLSHPGVKLGWLAWPLAIAGHLWILRRLEPADAPRYAAMMHAVGALVVAALGSAELHWWAQAYAAPYSAWSVGAAALVPAVLALWLASSAMDERWPVEAAPRAYRVNANGLIALALVAWTLYANFTHDGNSDPLPYLPIVNALDLMQVFAAFALFGIWRAATRLDEGILSPRAAGAIGGALAFVWLNGVLLRSLHHWADVPYTLTGIVGSTLAQAALSMFWSVLALALMVVATRKARRLLWMVGAALMAVVVVKLFLLDLSHVTGITRIVSFIGIGLLMLVVGYVSPVPPNRKEAS